jgi:hypothetical protein
MSMPYWIIQHDLGSFADRSDAVGMPESKANGDRAFRQIRAKDKIVYYAQRNLTLGLYEVTKPWIQLKSWSKTRPGLHRAHAIRPIYARICELKLRDFGVKSTRGRTAIALTLDQYGKIKDHILGMQEPTDHEGTLALFSKIHAGLGFPRLERIQSAYPDVVCVDEQGNRLRIELEYESHTFQTEHAGRYDQCDLIVCWDDTWGQAAQKPVRSMKELLY